MQTVLKRIIFLLSQEVYCQLSIDPLSSPKLIYLNSKQIRETNSKVILSVSIGTDKSTAAIYQDGQILSLVNIPSAIAYTHDGKCLVGSQAIEQNSWFEKFIYLIGASNDELLNLITQVPYKIAKGTEQQIILYCSALNKWFTAEELLIELLCEILNRCNDHLDSHIDRIILTIPPFLDNIFCREIIKNSAKLAGIEIVRIWNETLSYGVASAFLSGHLGASHNTYLIIAADDFCIDCCLLEIGNGVVEVLGNFLQYPDFGELTKSTGDRLVIGAMEKVLQWSNITNIDALVIPIDLAKLSAMTAINDSRLVDRAKEIIWARNIAAYGTTLEAATLMRKLKNFLVLNTTTLALGIKTKKGIVKIVSECTTIPTLKKVSFLWHGDSGQIVIPIVELKGREDRILGYLYLDVVAIKQSSIVEITFDLDANHILTVMAVDKTSNNPKSLTVTSQTLLTQTATWFSDDRLLDQEAET